MPPVNTSVNSRDRLVRSLKVYSSELKEMIDAIGEQAKFVEEKAENHVPRDLSDEYRLAKESMQIVLTK
jgi:hypothetical protein